MTALPCLVCAGSGAPSGSYVVMTSQLKGFIRFLQCGLPSRLLKAGQLNHLSSLKRSNLSSLLQNRSEFVTVGVDRVTPLAFCVHVQLKSLDVVLGKLKKT